jgi:hypothetical protein
MLKVYELGLLLYTNAVLVNVCFGLQNLSLTKFYKLQFVAFGDAGRRLQVPHTIIKKF